MKTCNKNCAESVSKVNNPKSSKGLSLRRLNRKLQRLGYAPLRQGYRTLDLWTEGKPDENTVEVPWKSTWETEKGHYSVVAKIDSEFSTIYWTLTLRLVRFDPKLNPRIGFLGPFSVCQIHNILEEDLPRLPEFEAILAKGGSKLPLG